MEEIKANQISPLHGIKDAGLLAELTESMLSNGWTGRPLIAYQDDEQHYQALTGSHRWAAAKATGIMISVRILTDDELVVLTDASGWTDYGTINAEDAVVALRLAAEFAHPSDMYDFRVDQAGYFAPCKVTVTEFGRVTREYECTGEGEE